MIACSTPQQVPELINFEQYFAALQRSDFTTRYGIVEFTIRYDRGRLQLTSGEEVFLQRHDETFRIERVTGGLHDDALRERTDSVLAYLQRFKILLIRHRAGPDYVLIFDRRGFDPASLPEVEVVHPPHGDEHIPVGVLLFAPGGVAESPSLVVRKSTRIADDWFYHEGEVLHQFAPE
jgi:hypothetical protein